MCCSYNDKSIGPRNSCTHVGFGPTSGPSELVHRELPGYSPLPTPIRRDSARPIRSTAAGRCPVRSPGLEPSAQPIVYLPTGSSRAARRRHRNRAQPEQRRRPGPGCLVSWPTSRRAQADVRSSIPAVWSSLFCSCSSAPIQLRPQVGGIFLLSAP